MVSSLEEIEFIKREIKKIKNELRLQGHSFSENVKIGVVIETPASAIISDEICSQVDFVSINTDNLIQYTLAMDRDNQKLLDFYRPYHPAIRRLVKLVADNAHKRGKKVSLFGEIADDTAVTMNLLALKIDELILRPSSILKVKAKVRETDTTDALRKLWGKI